MRWPFRWPRRRAAARWTRCGDYVELVRRGDLQGASWCFHPAVPPYRMTLNRPGVELRSPLPHVEGSPQAVREGLDRCSMEHPCAEWSFRHMVLWGECWSLKRPLEASSTGS